MKSSEDECNRNITPARGFGLKLLDCFGLDCELLRVETLRKLLVEGGDVIRLTVALLVFGVFTPSVFAQSLGGIESAEQHEHRFRILSDWLEMVKSAERHYKNKNHRYGDLGALFKAHLLRGLVFEADPSAGVRSKAQLSLVPNIEVTVSEDGQHFTAVIREHCVNINADDMGGEWSVCCCWSPFLHRDFDDSPEGPIIAIAR